MHLVFIENLKAGMTASQDVFAENNRMIPVVKKNTKLDESTLERLKIWNIRFIYVEDGFETVQRSTIPVRNEIYIPQPKPIITMKLKEEAIESIKVIFLTASIDHDDIHASSAEIMRQLNKIVEQLVDSIENDKNALININDLKSYDDYTFHHSLSVAVLSIAIGQYLGYSHNMLNHIGKTALMHDIGKTTVPIEIIHKTSELDENELKIIKNHSPAGYEYLMKGNIGDGDMWLGVLHHHEKYNGTGYPAGIKGAEIPLESRIIAVADVYDALTSNRPYRNPLPPAEAIEYIMGNTGTLFDFDIVSAFVNVVGVYSVSSIVELSDGRHATVINNEHRMRPIVRLNNTGEVLDLFRDKSCYNIVIKRIVPENEISMQH